MGRGFCLAALCLLLGITAAGATPGQIHLAPDGGLTLRAAPEATAPEIGQLEGGQRLLEFERQGPWVRVALFGGSRQEGWVPEAKLVAPPRVVPEPPLPEPIPLPRIDPSFILDISGSPAREFIGECIRVNRLGERRKLKFKGFIPKKYRFRGAALRCLVQKWDARGRLQVGLRTGGKLIAYKDTAAQFNWVRVYSKGPWGRAGSVRGNQPTIFFTRGKRQGVVPPFKPPVVPPFPVHGAS